MPNAYERGWGDPTVKGYRELHIIPVQAGGRTLYVRREVAHLFMGFLQELVHRGYPLDVGAVDDWGWICRPVRGYEKQWAQTHDFRFLSEHSWGLAVDINTRTNPMTLDGKVHTDMPPWVGDLAEKWGLRWGANYTGSRKDPQHFEFMGRPSDVARYPINDHPIAQPVKEDDVPAPSDVVASLPTPSGKGRWLLTYDGGVRTEGDAKFYGSVPGLPEKDRQGVGGFWVIEPYEGGYMVTDTKGNAYRFGKPKAA